MGFRMDADRRAIADRGERLGLGEDLRILAEPTSRYCDHRPRATSAVRRAFASSEPGVTAERSVPISAASAARTAVAWAGSPLHCSSTTRSRRLAAKVTPAALHGLQVDRR